MASSSSPLSTKTYVLIGVAGLLLVFAVYMLFFRSTATVAPPDAETQAAVQKLEAESESTPPPEEPGTVSKGGARKPNRPGN